MVHTLYSWFLQLLYKRGKVKSDDRSHGVTVVRTLWMRGGGRNCRLAVLSHARGYHTKHDGARLALGRLSQSRRRWRRGRPQTARGAEQVAGRERDALQPPRAPVRGMPRGGGMQRKLLLLLLGRSGIGRGERRGDDVLADGTPDERASGDDAREEDLDG